jgi:hypothetical protein
VQHSVPRDNVVTASASAREASTGGGGRASASTPNATSADNDDDGDDGGDDNVATNRDMKNALRPARTAMLTQLAKINPTLPKSDVNCHAARRKTAENPIIQTL